MKTFHVTVIEHHLVEVEADTLDDALDKGYGAVRSMDTFLGHDVEAVRDAETKEVLWEI